MYTDEWEEKKKTAIKRRNTGEISFEELQETSDSIKGVYASEIKENVLLSNKGKVTIDENEPESESQSDIEIMEYGFLFKLAKDTLFTIVEEESVQEDIFELMDELVVSNESKSFEKSLKSLGVINNIEWNSHKTMDNVKEKFNHRESTWILDKISRSKML